MLTKEIQELSAEVASSRIYIDKLLKTSRDTTHSDWELKEQQYKAIVRNLRQRLVKEQSMVSIDLYKAAIDSGRQKVTELKESQKKVESLSTKVSELKKELKTKDVTRTKTPQRDTGFAQLGFGSPTDFLEKGLLNGSQRIISARKKYDGRECRMVTLQGNDSQAPLRQPLESNGQDSSLTPLVTTRSLRGDHQEVEIRDDKLPTEANPTYSPLQSDIDGNGILSWVDNYAAAMQKNKRREGMREDLSRKMVETGTVERFRRVENRLAAIRSGDLGCESERKKDAKVNSYENRPLESSSTDRHQPQSANRQASSTVVKSGSQERRDENMKKPNSEFGRKTHKSSGSTRIAKVRAAGGRKGLEDQLRKLRSPPCRGRAPFRRIN